MLKTLFKKTNCTYFTVVKIMIPALIIVKVLEELGVVNWLGTVLYPVMNIMGLPGEIGLVWATTLCVNIYAGLAVFFTYTDVDGLTAMQVTILGSIMLMGHALLIEGTIAKKVGLRWRYTILTRIGGAFLFGFLVKTVCLRFNFLQHTAVLGNFTAREPHTTLQEWILEQVYGLLIIYIVITFLLIFLRILEKIGITHLIQKILSPLLGTIGINKKAISLTLIGLTFGLSYGGGLLINEANSGTINRKDTVLSVCFIGLFHSLFEDPLLVLLMGTNLVIAVGVRFVFVLAIMYCINVLISMKAHTRTVPFNKH